MILGALVLALSWTPAYGDPAGEASTALLTADCGESLDQLLAAEPAVCRVPEEPADPIGLEPFTFAAAPHCCGTGALDACRESCRQLGPGCKGSIGCRAGECVCTCSC